ncbi:MAG: septum formation initiator family protein [Bacteroidaceae bacterium]|nr:septum formation initiator family protein [Bacteroidaceae bacterium]
MGRFQNIVSGIRNFKYTKYIVTLCIFVVVVGFVDDNSFMNRQERIEEIERLQEEIAVLKNQYEEDTRKLNNLTDYDNVVRLAREKYLMKRPDEDIFIIKYVTPTE